MGENRNKKFDLMERTTKFGEEIIIFSQRIPRNIITLPLINQCVKSGTSIGANYCEADDAESGHDFTHKIGICKKESRETEYWLKIISVAVPSLKKETEKLQQEAKELNLIFNSIVKKINNKRNNFINSIS